jgi:hypothetical protein
MKVVDHVALMGEMTSTCEPEGKKLLGVERNGSSRNGI